MGRAEEFLSLTEASKPASGVVVLGDPGVGKTRLARAAVDAHYAAAPGSSGLRAPPVRADCRWARSRTWFPMPTSTPTTPAGSSA